MRNAIAVSSGGLKASFDAVSTLSGGTQWSDCGHVTGSVTESGRGNCEATALSATATYQTAKKLRTAHLIRRESVSLSEQRAGGLNGQCSRSFTQVAT